jgi:hypothetical protein
MHMRNGRGSTDAKQDGEEKITKDITGNRDNKGEKKGMTQVIKKDRRRRQSDPYVYLTVAV